MHHSLLLPDIFRRILDYLEILPLGDFHSGYEQARLGNASIARLARTCRAFLEPSLNVLWKHQLTLCALLKTLPEDAWEETEDRAIWMSHAPRYFHLNLRRPLKRSDWSRFDFYAPRITALGYFAIEFADQELRVWNTPSNYYRERELSPTAMAHLCLYRGSRWLLPNLTHLRWNIYDVPYTEYAPMFLGPSLRCLAFAFKPRGLTQPPYDPVVAQDGLVRILNALVLYCPNVRELELCPEYAKHVVVATQKFAYDCPRLEGYQINTTEHALFDRNFLMYIATKPHLRKVNLTLNSETAECLPLLSCPPVYHPFPSLQILRLKVPRLQACAALFVAMQHCRLFILHIEIQYQPPITDVVELFEELRTHCAQHTLHVFQLSQLKLSGGGQDVYPPHKEDHLLDINVLSLMFYFPNIRNFECRLPLYGWLTDEDLRAVGLAWPGIASFSIHDTYGSPADAPATWEGIASLVSLCPLLTTLCVGFNTTRNLDVAYSYNAAVLDSQLRFINVVDSKLPEDPGILAHALFSIAPRIVAAMLVERCDPDEDPDAPMSFDPYAYSAQVDMIMCRLRSERFGVEFTADVLGANKTGNSLDSQPLEWNPWSQR